LQTACRLAPRDAEYRYKLGLALNEIGRLDEAQAALAEAVKLDPQFARAWYNLGLAYSAQDKVEPALDALLRAESLDVRSPQIPYARATILARLGRRDEARRAAQRALELQPSFPAAADLLRALAR
jgi:Flp pilus assembly protein TadD